MAGNWFSDAFANPQFKQFLSEAGQDLGYGLTQSPTIGGAFGEATRRSQQLQPMRDLATEKRAEVAKLTEQGNVTRSWLEQQGFTDLVPLVDAGQASAAYGEALKRMQPGYGAGAGPMEINGQLVDPTTGQILGDYRDPNAGRAEPPRVEMRYNEQTGREEKVTWNPQTGAWDSFGGPKSVTERAEFNATQATAAGFADRMIQSDALLSDPGLTAASMDRGQVIKSGTPLIGNNLVTAEYRQADQAKRDFINAILRRESGAVIGADEFANANLQYFPQPGDDQNTLNQKAANRRNAITGVSRSAGPAYQPPDTTNYLTGGNTPAANGPRTTQSGVSYQVDQ